MIENWSLIIDYSPYYFVYICNFLLTNEKLYLLKIMTAYQLALINGSPIGRSCFCFWLIKRHELNMLFVNVNINNIFLLKFCFMFFSRAGVAVIVWIHLWHWAREIVSPVLQKLTFHFGQFHQQGRLLFKACLSCQKEMAYHLIVKKA